MTSIDSRDAVGSATDPEPSRSFDDSVGRSATGAASSLPAGFARLHAAAVHALQVWTAPNPDQERLRRGYLDHLGRRPDGVWRHGPPEHLTVGMLVLDESGRRVLLTHHRKARRWFQLGGHLEAADVSLAGAALREAREESGLASLSVVPGVLQLDRHALPPSFGGCREHLDVRYLAVAPTDSRPTVSEESLDVAWFDVAGLPDPELEELVAAGCARLDALRRMGRFARVRR